MKHSWALPKNNNIFELLAILVGKGLFGYLYIFIFCFSSKILLSGNILILCDKGFIKLAVVTVFLLGLLSNNFNLSWIEYLF